MKTLITRWVITAGMLLLAACGEMVTPVNNTPNYSTQAPAGGSGGAPGY